MAGLDGTIISDNQGNYKILKGGQWVDYNPDSKGQGGGAPKMSTSAQNFLNDLSNKAAGAREVGKLYDSVEGSLKKLRPGPYRNSLLLSPAIPEDNGGILDKIGSVIVGGPARLLGAITGQEVNAYQDARRVQNAAVLERQLPQKGPQTESDAARMMLADVSPGKTMAANQKVISEGRKKIKREQARAIFYSRWASKYGLHGTEPNGMTADEVWNKAADHITEKLFPSQGAQATIKVISRRKK